MSLIVNLLGAGGRQTISLGSRSAMPGNIVVPPGSTVLYWLYCGSAQAT